MKPVNFHFSPRWKHDARTLAKNNSDKFLKYNAAIFFNRINAPSKIIIQLQYLVDTKATCDTQKKYLISQCFNKNNSFHQGI